MLDIFSDPAAIGAALRPLFWLVVLGAIGIVAKFLPDKVRRIMYWRLF